MSATARETLELVRPQGPVPLGFARRGTSVFLVARERSARWPVELLRAGRATLRLASENLEGQVQLVVGRSEQEDVLELFRDKYGSERYRRWYEHPARVLEVQLGPPAAPVPEEHRYYGWLQSEFDNVAEDYDRHITGNRMNRLLRDRSLGRMRTLFRGARCLLEIGCGSGMETLPLLQEGHEITAIDISEQMLEVVRRKARTAGVAERLRTVRAPARDLPTLVPSLGEGSFDGAYSTYGALNCEPDLRPLPSAFHRLLRPESRLFAGVYNRWCLFEILGYGITGQWSRALGRRHRPVPVGTSRFCVDVYALTPADLRRDFAPYFEMEALEGVPILLPPSDLTSYAERFTSHFGLLDAWDRRMGAHWPLDHLGDHFLMTLRRRAVRDAGT
ncbi:MAG: class I SAM-dependent methyltransferase [Euryarchaeota archaeon]|nr:class I SAM-dependent methyltransferase [Euryarchaeota archaeon]MDE1835186.1 class I SAM-dependent methyltransferase [Euryarchaeota archaeon]MDE1880403.1 class I SAM-dependent methyltransferase [Euryarchaeota archaeon]MDE2045728.1 class I SAM-dependent methyltransferase [Thermoplasmata archaeon]